MTFETETYFTLGEYKKLSRKLMFKKRGPWILLVAAPLSLIILVLHWAGIITDLDPTYQSILLLFAALGLTILFAVNNAPEKHYNSNKLINQKRLYTFGEEQLSYTLQGAGGSLVWEYINRYDQVDNFLLLCASDRHAHIIRVDSLSAVQINFIKSKISMPERFSNVKAIR
jgi:hypothetical protein